MVNEYFMRSMLKRCSNNEPAFLIPEVKRVACLSDTDRSAGSVIKAAFFFRGLTPGRAAAAAAETKLNIQMATVAQFLLGLVLKLMLFLSFHLLMGSGRGSTRANHLSSRPPSESLTPTTQALLQPDSNRTRMPASSIGLRGR